MLNRTLLIAALVGVALASVHPAAARIWRGCAVEITVVAEGKARDIWSFEGRGSCKNKFHANDCRRAARGAIDYCIQDAWRARWDFRIPSSCYPTSGSSRPYVKGLANTSFGRGPGAQGDQDFKWAVERAVCCHLHPNRNRVTAQVSWNVHGDKGCRESVEEAQYLEAEYVAQCRRFRDRGFCD